MPKIFTFIITIILFSCNHLLACTCLGTESPKAAIRNADQVFRGKVMSEKLLVIPDEFGGQKTGVNHEFKQFTVQIEKTYKGKIKRGILTITTGIGRGDCGFDFQIGQEYVVYANWRDAFFNDGPTVTRYLHTDVCKRTTSLVDQEVDLMKAGRCFRKSRAY